MSSDSPMRPRAASLQYRRSTASRSCSDIPLHSGVFTTPAQTELTRIGARSETRPRVSDSTAPATAQVRAHPFQGRIATMPLVSVMDPPGRIYGAAAAWWRDRHPRSGPRRHGAPAAWWWMKAGAASPAVTMRWSRPLRDEKNRSRAASSVTSTVAPVTPAGSSASALSTLAWLRDAMTT